MPIVPETGLEKSRGGIATKSLMQHPIALVAVVVAGRLNTLLGLVVGLSVCLSVGLIECCCHRLFGWPMFCVYERNKKQTLYAATRLLDWVHNGNAGDAMKCDSASQQQQKAICLINH